VFSVVHCVSLVVLCDSLGSGSDRVQALFGVELIKTISQLDPPRKTSQLVYDADFL